MIANVLVNIFGALLFLFIFWKKLKEDYASEIIFSSAFIIFWSILISHFVAIRFIPAWFFWIETVGVMVGFLITLLRFKMRGYELFDAVVISILPWISIFFLKDAVISSSIISFVGFIVILLFISIYYLLDVSYKRFTWYKSGKIGFSGLTTISLLFLLRAGIATKIPTVLSFVVAYEPYISGSVALIGFLLVFNLSRRLD